MFLPVRLLLPFARRLPVSRPSASHRQSVAQAEFAATLTQPQPLRAARAKVIVELQNWRIGQMRTFQAQARTYSAQGRPQEARKALQKARLAQGYLSALTDDLEALGRTLGQA